MYFRFLKIKPSRCTFPFTRSPFHNSHSKQKNSPSYLSIETAGNESSGLLMPFLKISSMPGVSRISKSVAVFSLSKRLNREIESALLETLSAPLFMKFAISSMGTGNMMVEFFSTAMFCRVCRYLSCMEQDDSVKVSAAFLKAFDAFCSPSAAITLALASRVASASAAMARCN